MHCIPAPVTAGGGVLMDAHFRRSNEVLIGSDRTGAAEGWESAGEVLETYWSSVGFVMHEMVLQRRVEVVARAGSWETL